MGQVLRTPPTFRADNTPLIRTSCGEPSVFGAWGGMAACDSRRSRFHRISSVDDAGHDTAPQPDRCARAARARGARAGHPSAPPERRARPSPRHPSACRPSARARAPRPPERGPPERALPERALPERGPPERGPPEAGPTGSRTRRDPRQAEAASDSSLLSSSAPKIATSRPLVHSMSAASSGTSPLTRGIGTDTDLVCAK